MASPTQRNHAAQYALDSGHMPSGKPETPTVMTAVWTRAMTTKEPDTLLMVTLGGALSRASGSIACDAG